MASGIYPHAILHFQNLRIGFDRSVTIFTILLEMNPSTKAAGPRPVSQEEFDLVVEENVTEFGMSEEEAISAVLREFSKRDLSGVAVTKEDRQLKLSVLRLCETIGSFRKDLAAVLQMLTNPQNDFAVKALIDNGAVGMAMKLCVEDGSDDAFQVVSEICNKSAFARDVVPREGLEAFNSLLKKALSGDDQTVIDRCLLTFISVMRGNEMNKRVLNEIDFGVVLVQIMERNSPMKNDLERRIFINAVRCVCAFLQRDDGRKGTLDQDDFGRGRRLGEETSLVSLLVGHLILDPLVITALKLMCVSDKVCLKAIEAGVLEDANQMRLLGTSSQTRTTGLTLLRTLCLNDDAKKRLGMNKDFIAALLQSIEVGLDENDAQLTAAALGCAEMMVLRQPQCAEHLADLGAIPFVVRALKETKDLESLKYGLRALRNMMSSPENHHLRQQALDLGAEEACRALTKTPQLNDYIEACLRDLGIAKYHV